MREPYAACLQLLDRPCVIAIGLLLAGLELLQPGLQFGHVMSDLLDQRNEVALIGRRHVTLGRCLRHRGRWIAGAR